MRWFFKNATVLAAVVLLQVSSSMASAQTAGGLTSQEMEAARKAIDPERKLTESQRNLAALGSIYQFWANKGEPEKAQRMAFQMLQHYRLLLQRYAAIAAQAKQQGSMNLATKTALKAYTNVPDGRDAHITFDNDSNRVIYHYVDADGKAVSKKIVTPQQLASSAMGLGVDGFDSALLLAAGQTDEASSRTGVGTANTSGTGVTRNGPPQLLYLPPPPSVVIEEYVPPTKMSPPSINCVTLKDELGGASTTHCAPD